MPAISDKRHRTSLSKSLKSSKTWPQMTSKTLFSKNSSAPMSTYAISCFWFLRETNIWPIREIVTLLSQSSSFLCFSRAISPETQSSSSILHLRCFKWNSFLSRKFSATFSYGLNAVLKFSPMSSKLCKTLLRMKDIRSFYFQSIYTQKSYPPWHSFTVQNQTLWKISFNKESSHFVNNYTTGFPKFLTKGLQMIILKT